VAGIGDINGDGYDDVAIGLPGLFSTSPGRVQLYFGADSMDNIVDKTIGEQNTELGLFGWVVSGFGDVNNDGYDDFGIMAHTHIKIILGNDDLNAFTEMKLIPIRSYWNLASCQDLNQDGFDDFITVSDDTRIFFGSETPDTTYDLLVPHFFKYVSGIGDINNDNNLEIILGENPDNREKVFIYSYRHQNNVADFEPIGYNDFILFQNHPNPFNNQTVISYQLARESDVNIYIYDILGKLIKVFSSKDQQPGRHKINWYGENRFGDIVSSGIYFCQLNVNDKVSTKKLILAK
jgi:hypothetical protein